MAVGEYISSSLSAKFPDKMAQKRWTSLLTSSDEIFFIFWLEDTTRLYSLEQSQGIKHVLERAAGARPDSRHSQLTLQVQPENDPTNGASGVLVA
jgi:hypothetical protein